MSDPEVPQPEKRTDDDVVTSANEGLAEADAARADVTGTDADGTDAAAPSGSEPDAAPADGSADAASADRAPEIDPDLAAFEAAAVDYLVKPVRRERLAEAIERVRRRRPEQSPRLPAPDGRCPPLAPIRIAAPYEAAR